MLKIKQYVLPVCLLVLVAAINIYFRSFPIHFPQLKKQAKQIVQDRVRQVVIQEVSSKFAQFNPLARERLLKSKLAEYFRYNKPAIQSQTQNVYQQLVERYQDEQGNTYMMELDCWHWGRYVENVLRLGHPGDEVVYGEQLDRLMLAPLGSAIPRDQFLYYFSAFLYKIYSFFNPMPLFIFLFRLPLFFIAIFIIALFIFSYRLAGLIPAVISCLFVGLAPIFLPRSCAGWFDKDIFNLIFPLLTVWAYAQGYEAESLKLRFAWVALAGFWIGLFSFGWISWWFIFSVIILYEMISIAKLIFTSWLYKKDNRVLWRERVITAGFFIFMSMFWILLVAGAKPLIAFFREALITLVLNRPLRASIWPNVYYTVGELKRVRLQEIGGSTGNSFIFIIATVSLLWLTFQAFFKKKYSGFKQTSILILFIWFMSMLFATMKGVRFIMFLLIPLGISLGWVLQEIYAYFMRRNKKIFAYAVIMSVGILSMLFINKGYRVASSIYPLMTDSWYRVLNLMKDTTPTNSIINSWWDFGDWFKVVGKRRVIFDGQSQNLPQAYWMANVLLTDNEEKAVRILRMLNNGANKAFEVIEEQLKEPLRSVLLLESVLVAEPERAKQILLEFLPPGAAQEVLELVFVPSKDAAYFVVDSSMPFKIGAISYLGNWDFAKVYMAQKFQEKEKDKILDYLIKLGRNSQEVQRLYQEAFLITGAELESWVSRPLQFQSGIARGQLKGDTVLFDNGFTYNPGQQVIYTSGRQIPRSLFVFKNDTLVEIVYTNSNMSFSVLVYKEGNEYRMVLLDSELARSMFVRMYYLNGAGLSHFRTHIDAEEGNDYIRVFRVIW